MTRNIQMTTSNNSRSVRHEQFLQALRPVQKRLEAYAFAMARDPEEASDVVGETILRCYERFDTIVAPDAFPGYVLTVASNIIRRLARRRRPFGVYNEADASRRRYGGTPPDVAVDIRILYEALEELPASQREAIVLFELADLPLCDIVKIQGGTLAALKVRLHRARKQLGRSLGISPEPIIASFTPDTQPDTP